MAKTTTGTVDAAHPQVGMLAAVRNRRALITSVEPYPGRHGVTHLVRLEYTDFDGEPEESVIWEREHGATVIRRRRALRPRHRRRSRLGERFLPWQLEQSVEESWEECRRHAELIEKIVGPLPQSGDTSGSNDVSRSEGSEDEATATSGPRQLEFFDAGGGPA